MWAWVTQEVSATTRTPARPQVLSSCARGERMQDGTAQPPLCSDIKNEPHPAERAAR